MIGHRRALEKEDCKVNAVSGPKSFSEAKDRMSDNASQAVSNFVEDMSEFKRKFSLKKVLPGAKAKSQAKEAHDLQEFFYGGVDYRLAEKQTERDYGLYHGQDIIFDLYGK
ncbi:hypothetical protein FSARC_5220 [Fusarium sarcochroum]|uniref:Uncharacterized protein n=1 Tax=Fusarium sarcochroum TaxID=1208366 RepID=A0A8H4X9R1_9HYPO|nr:hypothetical protein FSARC_5220 [Fusarium sarcochroum]